MAKRVSIGGALVFAVSCLLASAPRASGQPQEPETPDEKTALKASVKSLVESAEKFLKKTVRISGRLENAGKNYFTDLDVVLKDAQGNSIRVRPWLPVALPPPPPGPVGKRPEVLSQYLGKEVELTGVVERGTVRKAGEVYLLEVKSARVVQ